MRTVKYLSVSRRAHAINIKLVKKEQVSSIADPSNGMQMNFDVSKSAVHITGKVQDQVEQSFPCRSDKASPYPRNGEA